MVEAFSQKLGLTKDFGRVGFPFYSCNSCARQNTNKLLEVKYQVEHPNEFFYFNTTT